MSLILRILNIKENESWGSYMLTTERSGNAAVTWLKNSKGRNYYEDRYRLLTKAAPLVEKGGRGELYAVMDGMGSAPLGMTAAQQVCDDLIKFYREPNRFSADEASLLHLLSESNMTINGWGCVDGTDRPLGGAVGTIAWINDMQLTIFHAGDSAGILLGDRHLPNVLTSRHESGGGITRYFGMGRKLEIEVRRMPLKYGDLLLLVSDGITKVFSPIEAGVHVLEEYHRTGDIGFAAQQIVRVSRSRGESDDITALIIELEEE